MTPNLDPNSHEPLIDSALIGLDLTAEHHLANCPCCQGEREKTEHALRDFAELQREQANRSERFWQDQAARIREARAQISQRSPFRTALVPALALLLLLALQLTPQKETSPKPVQQTQTISDHDLLVEVERTMNTATPYALEPVALLSDDNEATYAVSDQNHPKEPRPHAN
jgi:hypothetical protein